MKSPLTMISGGKKMKTFLLRSGAGYKGRIPSLPLLFNIVVEAPAIAVR